VVEAINDPAVAPIAEPFVPAVRLSPPIQVAPTLPPPPSGIWGLPFAPEGLSNCDEMSFYRQQFGLPARFDGIGWRESNCRNEDGVHTSCCWGYWQLHQMHLGGEVYARNCDVHSYRDVNSDNPLEKQKQACAAKQLYDAAGTSPWAATR
jgi:hypothetical protein